MILHARTAAFLVLAAGLMIAPAVLADYSFTSFDDPNNPAGSGVRAFGINNAGRVVGYAGNVDESFIRNADGSVTSFFPPGAVRPKAEGITSSGQVLVNDDLGSQAVLRNADGSFKTLFVSVLGSVSFNALGINDNLQVVGFYNDAQSNPHGFIRSANGSFTPVDYKNDPSTYGTSLSGISNAGVAVGAEYNLNDGIYHGLIRNADGSFTTFDPAGSTFTDALGINNLGQVVGYYTDANSVHGFVRNSNGSFTTIDVPFAGATFTFVQGINDSGELSGWYRDSSGVDHGFIAVPSAVPEPSSLLLIGLGLLLSGRTLRPWRRG